MGKNTICLWYDKDAEAAALFYAETFLDSVVGAVHRAPSDYPSGKAGDVLMVVSGGFEPLHLRIRIREDSPLGAGALERAHLD